MISSKKILWVGIGAAALVAAALFVTFCGLRTPSHISLHPTSTVSLDGFPVRVVVADTPAERAQGLSGVGGLAEDEGMLFVFPKDGEPSFWMKDMLFPIDMLWIDAAGRVVFIVPSVSPNTYPHAFTPNTPSRYVMELPAGFAMQHKIEVGSKLEI